MVIFLYTDKKCEHQAIACIKSFESKLTDDIKVLYFTVGFDSQFECKNLRKVKIDYLDYPSFHYYKAELSIRALEQFPEEYYFVFTDTDILFSKRLDFKNLEHKYTYPLAVFGPHEYPFIYEEINGERIIYQETELMKYMNVPIRTLMYQWSCFYSFNQDCRDFLEEYTSVCQNKYLIGKKKIYFPFHDETAFNVCLWKRQANQSLGYVFVNTHLLDTVKMVEEKQITNLSPSKNLDQLGADWEYIKDSSKVILYHGFKEEKDINQTLDYLLNKKTHGKEIIIVNTYPNSQKKLQVLENYILQLKKSNRPILLSSHLSLPKSIIDLVDFYIFDKENILLPNNRSPVKWFANDYDYIEIGCQVKHCLAITRSMFYSFNFAKNMGYESFLFTEYDNTLSDTDIPKIDELFSLLYKTQKNIIAFTSKWEWDSDISFVYQTSMFCGNTNYFLNNIPLPKTYEEWCNTEPYSTSYDILEKILTKILLTKNDDIFSMKKADREYFDNSVIDLFHVGVSDQNNSIVYNVENIYNPLFFYIINEDGFYELIIDNLIVQSGNYKKDDWFIHYFTIPHRGDILIKFLQNNEILFTRSVDKNIIENIKDVSIRKSIFK